jgi:hypothetical protein
VLKWALPGVGGIRDRVTLVKHSGHGAETGDA